jgi:hypothetical protein
MDHRDMTYWLNSLAETGWDLVTAGTTHWVSDSVQTQDWWVFKRVAKSNWRKIETAPREVEFRCILGHGSSVVTGYWDGKGWRNERSAGLKYFPATHWMPLPDMPTVDD